MSNVSAFYSGTVGSGQVLSGVTIAADQSVTVNRGGTFESSTILFYGSAYVARGGHAEALIVNGGTLTLDGTATGTTLTGADADMEVDAGLAISTTITSGGDQFVSYDVDNAQLHGRALDTKVGFGGSQRLFYGSAANTQVGRGGLQEVETSGSYASNTEVLRGGEMELYGLATEITVHSGADFLVGSGADAAGIVQAGGTLIVTQSGADLGALVLNAGATVAFLSGATASGLITGPGVLVESGAVQINSAVGAASLLVAVGDKLSGNTVGLAETETVHAGGHVSATTVVDGGVQIVRSGGAATGTMLYGGSQSIAETAKVSGTEVFSGGFETISAGSATDTTVYAGGLQAVGYYGFATASGTVLSGGVQKINTDGRSFNTQIMRGGEEVVTLFTSSVDTTIHAGGVEDVDQASAIGSVVDSGGQLLDIDFLSQLSDCTVSAGGYLVLSGVPGYSTIVSHTTIQPGGTLVLVNDATTSGVTIDSGAVVTSVNVAIFSGTAYAPDGRYVIEPQLSGGTIGAYSSEVVTDGGTVQSTTIAPGGYQSVQGGTAIDTIVQSDGQQEAGSGLLGPANLVGTVIDNGGVQRLYNGASATNPTIQAGGFLVVSSGATVSNLSMSIGGTLDLATLGYRSGGTVHLNAHDQLIVYEGGTTVAIQMVGNYTGEQFVTADNYDHGTYILLSAVSAASANAAQTGELLPALAAPLAVPQSPAAGATRPLPSAAAFEAVRDQHNAQPMIIHPHQP